MNIHRTSNIAMASALTGVLSVTLAACSPSTQSSPLPPEATSLGNEIDDTVVTARVKVALMRDPLINSYDFKVDTHKGEVMLSGFVDSQEQLDRASRVMHNVEGVKSIRNYVALKGAAASVGNKLDDSIITGQIKAALLSDSVIQSMDIHVVTRVDAVQLSGFVNNQQQMDRAMGIASAIRGVRSVANGLQIKK